MALFLIIFIAIPAIALIRFFSKEKETSIDSSPVETIDVKALIEFNEKDLERQRALLEEVRRERRALGIPDDDEKYKYDDVEEEDDDDDDEIFGEKKDKHPFADALGLGIGIGIVSGLTGHHIGIGGSSCNGNS